MISSDHRKEGSGKVLVRLHGKPNFDSSSGVLQDLRIFMQMAGSLLLHFAAISIDEVHKTPELIRGLLKTLKVKLRIGTILNIDLGPEAGSAKQSTDQTADRQAQTIAALQDVADCVETIRLKGGAVGFMVTSLLKQLEQAHYEFPDDATLIALGRKVAYTELKSTAHLPSPPATALEIMKLTRDSNVETRKLVGVVSADPAIAARVLQYANSSFVALRIRATTIERAILSLGHTTLRNIALAFSLVSARRKGGCSEFDYGLYWTESTARAAAARHLAACNREGPDPDEAFVAGLLCQIGRLAFATALPVEYADVLRRVDPTMPDHLLILERREFHIDHRELAGEMMAEWGLPEPFWSAILFQGDWDNEQILPPNSPEQALAMTLAWADTVWKVIKAPVVPIGGELRESVLCQAERLGIERPALPDRFDTILDEWNAIGTMLNVTTLSVPCWADLVG